METNNRALEPIKKKSLYIEISDTIYNYIRLNELKPGDKLPSEREMSKMLETSRNSIREALRILENRGIIIVRMGKGVFISNTYGQNNTMTIQLNSCSQQDMYELQEILDIKCVCFAVDKGSAEQKEALLNIGLEMNKLAEEGIYSYSLDHQFHNLLYEINGNPAIQQLLLCIRKERYIGQVNEERYKKIWLKSIGYHADLAEAIIEKNKERAVNLIKEINQHSYNNSLRPRAFDSY